MGSLTKNQNRPPTQDTEGKPSTVPSVSTINLSSLFLLYFGLSYH